MRHVLNLFVSLLLGELKERESIERSHDLRLACMIDTTFSMT